MYKTGSYKYPLIPSSTGENMEEHWNADRIGISYNNKIILDLGASNGDSAEYFIYMGAKIVIAVEGNLNLGGKNIFEELCRNSFQFSGRMIPIFIYIESPEQIENLIVAFKPDIIKCDIEGAEEHLFNIKDEIWKMVPEYLVETHSCSYLPPELDKHMYRKCIKLKYTILKDMMMLSQIIYAKSEEK